VDERGVQCRRRMGRGRQLGRIGGRVGREDGEGITHPTRASVFAVAFSSRDRFPILAIACADNTSCAWFTKSGEPAFTLRGHRAGFTAVACSSDGGCLASASLDRTVKLWDIRWRDDDLTLRANVGYTSVAFSPAGPYLASATRDRAVRIWDMTTGKVVARLQSLPESVNGLAFSAAVRDP
jgi:WD40 repeat protein